MTPIQMMLAMFVAHALCDYPLQGDFLARAKNPVAPIPGVPWAWAMSAHCAIHAGAVGAITGSVVLAVIEFVLHFHFDNMKCRGRITFSGDQGLHLLTKAIFAGVIGLFGGMP